MIEHLPVAAVLRHPDGLALNRAAEDLTGYPRHELSTFDAWFACLHRRQVDQAGDLYQAIGLNHDETGRPRRLDITRRDGQTRQVELTICGVDETRDLWILVDLTKTDRALLRNEEHLRAILNTAVDAIITIDEWGVVQTFNAAAERMFGYDVAEVIGENVGILMPPPYRAEHDAHIARYLRTGESHIIGVGREVVCQRKDGSTFPADLAVSLQNEHPRRFTGILRDLSDRRKLEWRLAESQMEERRHMARELHDDIGGHMTGIGLLAQTLHADLVKAESALAARSRDLVRSIRDAHQHLREVIAGMMPVEASPDGLMAALQQFARQCEVVSGISCRFHCEPKVDVDDPGTALHLFRIVQEAVHNAVRHGRPKHISVSLEQTDRRLAVKVVDDGTGIVRAHHPHTGVGLESMRQRARLLGGDVSLHPRDGGGTVMACWVPARPAGATTPDGRG